MLFTAADLAAMREAAESVMTDSAQLVSETKTAGTFGGDVGGAEAEGDSFACRLVTKRTGKETSTEIRIFARVDYLLRYPYNITLRESQTVEVNGARYRVRAVADDRTEPHVQNLAGLDLLR